jgi:hypothetical protein
MRIELPAAHLRLTTACFRVMDDGLRFNICGIETSHRRNFEIDGISERVDNAISPELVYATHYWADHLQSAPKDFELLHHLERLMHTKFLFWLEVLSLKGQTLLAYSAIIKSLKCVQVSCPQPVLRMPLTNIHFLGAGAP